MEKSPSPVYGARLELVYALIAHRGFESLLLRQTAGTVLIVPADRKVIIKEFSSIILYGGSMFFCFTDLLTDSFSCRRPMNVKQPQVHRGIRLLL